MDAEAGASLRFADILTTASAVANYLGEAEVTARHVLAAIALLLEETTLEALGRPLSPLVRRPEARGASRPVRELAQRWFAALGDANATLDAAQVEALRAELGSVVD